MWILTCACLSINVTKRSFVAFLRCNQVNKYGFPDISMEDCCGHPIKCRASTIKARSRTWAHMRLIFDEDKSMRVVDGECPIASGIHYRGESSRSVIHDRIPGIGKEPWATQHRVSKCHQSDQWIRDSNIRTFRWWTHNSPPPVHRPVGSRLIEQTYISSSIVLKCMFLVISRVFA